MKSEKVRTILFTIGFLLFTSVAGYFIEREIYATSYSYVCWRVTRPFGPDRAAYDKVIEMSDPSKIFYLIERYDRPNYWWVEELLGYWFYEPYMMMPPYSHKEDGKKYWFGWWRRNKRDYSQLIMDVEPEFDIPSDD